MADIITTQVFSDGEKGITAQKLNNIVALSQIQTAFYNAKPTTSSFDPTDMLLTLKANGSYAQVSGTNVAASIGSATFGASRLRSYNAIGNPNFEVDQVSVGNVVTISGTKAIDRWLSTKTGTMVATAVQQGAVVPDVVVPGTNFRISRTFYRITLTTAQTSLGASDALYINQTVEGPFWRELSSDVHSFSILVRSSVAGLIFGVVIKDPPTPTKTLSLTCTIPTANTWTLIQLPNLPVWPSGNFGASPGLAGYQFNICLAAGSSITTPSNGTWLSGNWQGAFGQSNFANNAVNSTFDIAFVQHEPGANCTTLMDKPFSQNYDECLRYFCKSYDYGTALNTNTSAGAISYADANGAVYGYVPFPKRMAKVPTVTSYSQVVGVNAVYDQNGATNRAVTAISSTGTSSYTGLVVPGAVVSTGNYCVGHYTADTGW